MSARIHTETGCYRFTIRRLGTDEGKRLACRVPRRDCPRAPAPAIVSWFPRGGQDRILRGNGATRAQV